MANECNKESPQNPLLLAALIAWQRSKPDVYLLGFLPQQVYQPLTREKRAWHNIIPVYICEVQLMKLFGLCRLSTLRYASRQQWHHSFRKIHKEFTRFHFYVLTDHIFEGYKRLTFRFQKHVRYFYIVYRENAASIEALKRCALLLRKTVTCRGICNAM